MPWPNTASAKKPVFKLFYHEKDGIHDFSCNERVRKQLLAHGFPEEARYLAKAWGRHRLVYHFWRDEYNEPILDFFTRHAVK